MFMKKIKEAFKQKYYITNWHGDIIADNLSLLKAKNFCKNYKKEKVYIQKELPLY